MHEQDNMPACARLQAAGVEEWHSPHVCIWMCPDSAIQKWNRLELRAKENPDAQGD